MPLERFNQGVNETADPTELGQGEMTACSGFWLKSGDERLHLINPSSAFSAAASSVQDISILPFDNGPDALVVRANDSMYAVDVEAANPVLDTGNVSPALTALSGDRMVAAHYNDNWYLALGPSQRPQIITSSGSLPLASRNWGLQGPKEALTFAVSGGVTSAYRATATRTATGWTNHALARDADEDTFASATLTGGSSAAQLELITWAADTSSTRRMNVRWALTAEGQNYGGGYRRRGDGEPRSIFKVTVKFYKKDSDNGDTWVEFLNTTYRKSQPEQVTQVD